MELRGPKPLLIATVPASAAGPGRASSSRAEASVVVREREAPPPYVGSVQGVLALMALARSGKVSVQRMAAEAMCGLCTTHAMRQTFIQARSKMGGKGMRHETSLSIRLRSQARALAILAALARRYSDDKTTHHWCAIALQVRI